MEKFSSLILLLCIFGALCDKLPNFITDEEFIKARLDPIKPTNESSTDPLMNDTVEAITRPGFGSRFWTNAVVPYIVDTRFTAEQRHAVAQSIDDFHKKTCIRFTPRTHQANFVDIQLDNNECGLAYVCMIGGGQFAKVGGNCVNTGTISHELAHALCAGHEHTRRDRDDWLGFNAGCTPSGKDGSDMYRGLNKFYDYVSRLHYSNNQVGGCFNSKMPGVTQFGGTTGLSVLDFESLNEQYNCRGCHGHRYINPTKEALVNPFEAGYERNGEKLYACRAYHQGDIIPGKYNLRNGNCYIGWGGREHEKSGKDVEVLCNPHGTNLHWTTSFNTDTAIKGGRSRDRANIYNVKCEHTSTNGVVSVHPGKFQVDIGWSGVYMTLDGLEISCNKWQYMNCN